MLEALSLKKAYGSLKAWAMDGLDAMTWRGLGGSEAVYLVIALLTASALFGAIAVLRFRWEE